jgi:hypothetical protein
VRQQRFDLVVRNGTIVTPGHREQADVGITGGRIARIGGTMTGAGEIDAGGLLVIPGGIDAHVHLMCAQFTAQVAAAEPGEPVWVDDFWTGSLAAIAGGITTVGNMTFALPGESMTQAVARDMAGARAEAAVDWFLHPCSPAWATPNWRRSAPWPPAGTRASRCSCPIPASRPVPPAWPRLSPRRGEPGRSPWCTARTRTCWSGPAAS